MGRCSWATRERVREPVGVLDLLVGGHPLRAELALVLGVHPGLDTHDAAARDPQVHPALHTAEGAVGGHPPLVGMVGLPAPRRRRAGAVEVGHPGRRLEAEVLSVARAHRAKVGPLTLK